MADRLYDLVPRMYRTRDAELGEPMRALLRIIEGQFDLLDDDIERLWDNLFVETAEPWVIPYIGDLVGTVALFDASRIAPSDSLAEAFPDLRGPRLVPEVSLRARADVAKTIYYRRRKGTLAMLEELARDVTGWSAHAVEFFELLGWTQCVRNHLRFHAPRTPDLRSVERLDRLNGPFDEITHTVDVRPSDSLTGWYSIRNIGIFLFRLGAYEIRRVRARGGVAGFPFARHFSPLGNPAPIFSRWRREGDDAGLATPLHVPAPITYPAFFEDLRGHAGEKATDYYGLFESLPPAQNPEDLPVAPESSFCIFVDQLPVPPRLIVCMNLATWRQPPLDQVGVDVQRGRIALGPSHNAGADVDVYSHYGFSGNTGGGTYERTPFLVRSSLAEEVIDVPTTHATLEAALAAWAGGISSNTIIRILDNATYEPVNPIAIDLTSNRHLTIESADQTRPHILLTAPIEITGGGDDASLTLSGLLIEGSIHATGNIGELRLLHTTLVPGRALSDDDGAPVTQLPSIEVDGGGSLNTNLRISIAFSIVGPLRIATEVDRLAIFDSIVDGVGVTAICDSAVADGPGPPVWLERVTILGPVFVNELTMGSEVIFRDAVTSVRTQEGCVRFSYVAPHSKTPRRYRCQPDLEIDRQYDEQLAAGGSPVRAAIAALVNLWLLPSFTSERYGQPPYAQLHFHAPREISAGAEDGSEMGVFSFLKQPQREANLRLRLEEYLPFGLEPAVIHAT